MDRIITGLHIVVNYIYCYHIANFGRLKNDPIKQAKVYSEYEKLCGARQGSLNSQGTIVGQPNNTVHITQEQIAKEFGVSLTQLKDVKRLSTIPTELKQPISNWIDPAKEIDMRYVRNIKFHLRCLH